MKNLLKPGLLLVALNAAPAIADLDPQKMDQYIVAFERNITDQQLEICNELQWAGISDTRLFDMIESELLALLPVAMDERSVDLAAWYAKALGTSGQDKYLGTLQKMAAEGGASKRKRSKLDLKLKKYGQEGVDLLAKYKNWNPIISDTTNFRSDKSLQVNRFANMLQSNEWELRLIAVKRMNYEKIQDSYLLDLLNTNILSDYHAFDTARNSDDRLGDFEFMIKALAELRAPQYRETLQEIAKKSSNKMLIELARYILRKSD